MTKSVRFLPVSAIHMNLIPIRSAFCCCRTSRSCPTPRQWNPCGRRTALLAGNSTRGATSPWTGSPPRPRTARASAPIIRSAQDRSRPAARLRRGQSRPFLGPSDLPLAADTGAPRVAMGGVSGGAYVLARSGLLDGYRATIHWEHLPAFSEEFPHVSVERNLFVIDRDRLTCAGGIAALDLMHA